MGLILYSAPLTPPLRKRIDFDAVEEFENCINTYEYKPFALHALRPIQRMCVMNLLCAAASVVKRMGRRGGPLCPLPECHSPGGGLFLPPAPRLVVMHFMWGKHGVGAVCGHWCEADLCNHVHRGERSSEWLGRVLETDRAWWIPAL